MEIWPNFFIVGAPRCGTTSLWYYLNQSPEIFMSRKKEPWYFNSPEYVNVYPEKPISEKKEYLSLFQDVQNEKVVGEASTTYLADPTVPERIHKVLPESRIIISIRDPVERAFSFYLMIFERKLTKLNFSDIIENKENVIKENPIIREIFEPGFYFEQVKRYFRIFDSEKIKIIIFEEFIKDPKKIVEGLLKFLNVNNKILHFKPEAHNPYSVPRNSFSKAITDSEFVNKTAQRLFSPHMRIYLKEKIFTKKMTKPTLCEKDKDFLKNMYEDDVQNLKSLLHRSFPWQNF